MTKKIIFHVTETHYHALLLEDHEIVEYHQAHKDEKHIVGDIYLGVVKKILSGLNAAFVDIGHEKDAFLHYSDLSPGMRSMERLIKEVNNSKKPYDISKMELEPLTQKNGKIREVLKTGQKVIVRISKEVIHTKGLRVSSNLLLIGRYLIMVPFSNEITISQKIENARERTRLKNLIASIKPNNFGIIVRTAAQAQEGAILDQELKILHKQWTKGVAALAAAVAGEGERKLIKELQPICSILRDSSGNKFDQIVVDNKDAYEDIKKYMKAILPEVKKAVYLYQGKTNLLRYLHLDRKLESALSETVPIKEGGHLIIQQTEAVCAFDVNTGNYIATDDDQERIALFINLAATKEIARQLRLRDIGGIIVVDFIGMQDPQGRKKVYQAMKEHLKNDPAKFEVEQLSKFCVMEITRERVRPPVVIANQELCPTCNGSGRIQPSTSVVDFLEGQLKLLLLQHKLRNLIVHVHPYLYAFLHQGFFSKKWEWFLSYWRWIRVLQDSSLAVPDYRIFNSKKELVATNPRLVHPNPKLVVDAIVGGESKGIELVAAK